MRRLLALLALGALTACTPAQVDAWLRWHAEDPVAAEEFARRPEVVEALAAAQEPPSSSRYGDAVWTRIARCESGGRWDYPPVTNRSGTYSGGLMIGHEWWPAYGGREYAPAPYLASRADQITVAERIADDAGLDAAWQCYP